MPERRIKVRAEHVQKTFYERFLQVLRKGTEDKNQKSVVHKAFCSLKSYPLEVSTITDLKHIHGIGETLAVRCHSAWEAACAAHPSGFDLKTVKNLSDEDFISFISAAERLRTGSFVHPTLKSQTTTATAIAAATTTTTTATTANITGGFEKPTEGGESATLERNDKASHASMEFRENERVLQHFHLESESSIRNAAEGTFSENITYVVCQPSDQVEVILIADLRENNANFRGETVVGCLTKSHHRVEMRPLSVGDYLWVARKVDGTEMVLNWVVERKTWSDLHQSIRSGRYEEQKQRLRRSPMKNCVYLVEGTLTPQYSASEQALATTLVSDGFMIQRVKSPFHSAQFLLSITEYLKTLVARRQMSGIAFEYLQEWSKKAHAESVKDTWTRQMMVCPGMSSDRAQTVANRYPSMMSMMQLYYSSQIDQTNSVLSSAVPGLSQALSTQMSKFFSSVLD
ncbi:unnamed protein product [Haemonchus placei]|uniref:Crossover junction endonuclease MUS81 n=1 Tax=Haemonchus placei TaxID=6290 RepID=A0A0N4WB16_HAEPC|nr:unnamed protein product [Haemonchus placei]